MRPKCKTFWMWLRQAQKQFIKLESLVHILTCSSCMAEQRQEKENPQFGILVRIGLCIVFNYSCQDMLEKNGSQFTISLI